MLRFGAVILAALLYGLSSLGPGSQRQAPEDLIRALTRPLVLPELWQSLQESRRRGAPGEWVAKARILTGYFPTWVDGIVYFAWESSLAPVGRRADPETSLACLMASLAWLDEAVEKLATDKPMLAGEILLTQAFLVESRCMQDSQLAELMRERLGRDPSEVSAEFMDRAISLDPSESKTEQRITIIPRLIAGALRMQDLSRAEALTQTGIDKLAGLRDRELAAEWMGSLTRFRAFLDGDRSQSLEDLAKDPLLAEIIAAYRDR